MVALAVRTVQSFGVIALRLFYPLRLPDQCPLLDKILLRKRPIIETVNDQLKHLCQIEHSRHRSPFNFLVNLVSGLIAYTYHLNKRLLSIPGYELEDLPQAAF
jgi:hypothetical protein